MMQNIFLTLVGESPLLMHSDRGADKLNPDAQRHSNLVQSAKKEKTDAAYIEVAKSEFMLGLYWNKELGPYIPTINIRSCIIDGAKQHRRGSSAAAGIIILDPMAKLEYKGPRQPEALWEKKFYDARGVVVQRQRVMRYRPMFTDWSVSVDVTYDDEKINKEHLLLAADMAGRYVGLGDFRVNKKGTMGRFTIEYSE